LHLAISVSQEKAVKLLRDKGAKDIPLTPANTESAAKPSDKAAKPPAKRSGMGM